MTREILGTHQKALQINLDPSKYGTFAEIGAGQEVPRWFFRVGGAAGTIAKTHFGLRHDHQRRHLWPRRALRQPPAPGNDARARVRFVLERLGEKRGATTRFFVFADTVVARSYSRQDDAHGWLGIRFQTEPGAEPSQIIVHVRLWDKENLPEQEALGIVGVNLVHGAMYLHDDPAALIDSLVDNVGAERIEVDMIQFSGPAFAQVDNRLMALQLVQGGLTNAALVHVRRRRSFNRPTPFTKSASWSSAAAFAR